MGEMTCVVAVAVARAGDGCAIAVTVFFSSIICGEELRGQDGEKDERRAIHHSRDNLNESSANGWGD
jgi:hypothetical protein